MRISIQVMFALLIPPVTWFAKINALVLHGLPTTTTLMFLLAVS
jgi:hypothetical protein